MVNMEKMPKIIQGGMGIAVSGWQLANAVAREGQLGVVSGTGVAIVMVGRLNDGDPGGHVRRALAHFPDQEVAQGILDTYYIEGGKGPDKPYKRLTMWRVTPPKKLEQITVVANFVEVWLAKEGHNSPVGINLLEKVQMPNLASLYGAMLAGVDVVIMGAGIPMQIPGALDRFANHEAADYPLDVKQANGGGEVRITFDPRATFPALAEQVGPLKRPLFFPIVSSVVLAMALQKRANGEVNGFVIEMPTAGGHNAPPRGNYPINERGEPVYGDKDAVNLAKFRKLGLPFWLAGGYGSAEGLKTALAEGAQGIQVGTAFAYCDESGMDAAEREAVVKNVLDGGAEVLTSATASPTGFPFKVVQQPNTVADPAIYEGRGRVCDIGYLRHLRQDADGAMTYLCPAEPVDTYVKKGGAIEDTEGRMCLCNNLFAAAGQPQVRKGGYVEPSIITSGDDLPNIVQFIAEDETHYTAADVLRILLDE